MDRIKKQLREWDENLKEDSLPANPIGMASTWLSLACCWKGGKALNITQFKPTFEFWKGIYISFTLNIFFLN